MTAVEPMLCALCMRQHFLDIESEAARPQEMRPAETVFQGTATCYMHLEDLYAQTPISRVRPISLER